jgi:hypothetical protein
VQSYRSIDELELPMRLPEIFVRLLLSLSLSLPSLTGTLQAKDKALQQLRAGVASRELLMDELRLMHEQAASQEHLPESRFSIEVALTSLLSLSPSFNVFRSANCHSSVAAVRGLKGGLQDVDSIWTELHLALSEGVRQLGDHLTKAIDASTFSLSLSVSLVLTSRCGRCAAARLRRQCQRVHAVDVASCAPAAGQPGRAEGRRAAGTASTLRKHRCLSRSLPLCRACTVKVSRFLLTFASSQTFHEMQLQQQVELRRLKELERRVSETGFPYQNDDEQILSASVRDSTTRGAQ